MQALLPTPENLQTLVVYLRQTIDPDVSKRKVAENFLKGASLQPGFSTLLLRLMQANEVDPSTRQSAAIFFKNFVKNNWKEAELINKADRDQIKAVIVDLMLSVPPLIQKQLSASLELISEQDFPADWQNLLPDLVKRFETKDYKIVNGILHTAHSIFKRYRHQMKSDAVLTELKYILEIFQKPLLDLFLATDALINANVGNGGVLSTLFQSIKLILQIIYSLCSVDLPAFIEDNLTSIMSLLRKYFLFESKFEELVGDADEDTPGLLHQVQAVVCQSLNLFIGKYEEEFAPFLGTFVQDAWAMLMKMSNDAKYDQLATAAIGFLSSVASSVHHTLFKDPESLKLIIEKIVIPNLKLREIDIDLFADNSIEYIRRDIEGSDTDTRRRAATELVKGLRKFYEAETTQLCASYISTLLTQYAQNPKANWLAKDVSIYLVTALAVKGSTSTQGASQINPLVPVMDFFSSQILPELTSEQGPALVLKADALKFVSTFRQQLPRDTVLNLLPHLINQLTSKNYVVHSYAAACIERMLLVKDKIDNNNVNRYGKNELKIFLPNFLTNIFKTLETDQSKENDYLMKALMRMISTSQEEVIPYSPQIVNALVSILGKICKNPTNPSFNHYLFESISATIVIISNKSPDIVQNFEKLLFGPFTTILDSDVQEFSPYVFQVLALLLERTSSVSQPYLAILPPLTAPTLWERTANIPALTRLLQAYLRKGAPLIISGGFLMPILGVFQKLIASKIHDHEGFYILESIVQFIPKTEFTAHLKTVFTLIFTRLSRDKTLKFMKSFLVFLSLFIGIHGPMEVLEQIDQVQKDLFVMILDNIWIPNIQKVNGSIERKMAAVSMIKLLTECPRMLTDPYFSRWPKVNALLIEVLEGPEDESVPQDVADIDEEATGYTVFSQLVQAAKLEQDPFKEIDPKKLIAQNLYKLSREHPGKFAPLIAGLSPQSQGFLMQYFRISGAPEPYLVCCENIPRCLQQLSNNSNVHIHILSGTYSGNGFCGIEMGFIPLNNSAKGIYALNITADQGQTTIDCQQSNRSAIFNGTYITQLSLTGITFQNGLIDGDGGCVSFYKMEIPVRIQNCTFKSCVGENGGAIYAKDSHINLNGEITFQNNIAGTSGGAIYVENGKLESTDEINALFGGNRAGSGSGGAIYCMNSSIAFSSSGSITFNLNLAQLKGGAIYSLESPMSINPYTVFSYNRAFGGGAVGVQLNIKDAFVEIRGVFFGNYADSGGAIYYDGTSLLDLHDAIGHGNSVNRYGGFAYLLNFQYFAFNEAFNNSAGMRGGGVFLGHTVASPLSAMGGLFWENKGEDGQVDNIDCWTPDQVSVCKTCSVTSCRDCSTMCSVDEENSLCYDYQSNCVHGICYIIGNSNYTCDCQPGWTGILCDTGTDVPPGPDPPINNEVAWYWDLIIVIVVILTVVAIIFILRRLSNRRRGDYELIQ